VVGGAVYRDLHDRTCEMKRLHVRPIANGSGTGRLLCERLIERATRAGYDAMRLDTGTGNTEALVLYRDLFVERTPYADNPPEVLPYLLFLERPLAL
jgi:putative acetyltransferase